MKIKYPKHLSYKLNVQHESEVEMLTSVSRSVLPSNGKRSSEIKRGDLTCRAAARKEDIQHN